MPGKTTGTHQAMDGAMNLAKDPPLGPAPVASAPRKGRPERRDLIVTYPGGSFAGPFNTYVEAIWAGRRQRGDDRFAVGRVDDIRRTD